MKKTGLRAVAASMNRDRRFPGVGVGDLTRSAFPPLGLRVSCGEQFRMGVDVREALKRASMHGIRKVEFSEEVCELEALSVKTGLDVGEVGMIDEDMRTMLHFAWQDLESEVVCGRRAYKRVSAGAVWSAWWEGHARMDLCISVKAS